MLPAETLASRLLEPIDDVASIGVREESVHLK